MFVGTGGRSRLLLTICAAAMAVILFTGCGESSDPGRGTEMKVVGDIANPLCIDTLEDAPETKTIEYKDRNVQVLPVEALLQAAEPWGESFDILYQAGDGFSALISGEYLEQSFLALTETGWEAINLDHPVSSNIKNIEQIVVIAQAAEQFRISEPGKNVAALSIGDIYRRGYVTTLIQRGTSSVIHDDIELAATTFYQHKLVDPEAYIHLANSDAVVVGERGAVERWRQDGNLVLQANSLGYLLGDEMVIERAKGMIVNPPKRRITNVFHDARALLEQEERVLIILIDGFGYHQYEYARDNGHIPFLATLPEPEMAMSAYPSVTPVNVAASLTGELPHVNGVYQRGIHQTEVPTIFGWCEEQGLASVAIIGPIGTIELEIDPLFSIDRNEDGSTDDEKTETALEQLAEGGHDLFFVHYKDVDKAGHSYGDLHGETLAALQKIDGYVEQLAANWSGGVLIYADHGMHATDEGGDHGTLRTEDMFTPYWLFEVNADD